jgi:enolase
MGLAVAAKPGGKELVAAITDASKQCVIEVAVAFGTAAGERASSPAGGSLGSAKVLATHDKVIGTFVGEAALSSPTDVAYVVENGELHLYAVDGHDRVVRLK